MTTELPLLLAPQDLAALLGDKNLLIVDLGKSQVYEQAHVPGAVHLDFKRLLRGTQPAPGLLPDIATLSTLFSDLGLKASTRVVAYDDEGGGWAGRLLWTLDAIGHAHYAYLDGGIHAWLGEGLPTEADANNTQPSVYQVTNISPVTNVTLEEVLKRYQEPSIAIWDARSEEEFDGLRAYAQKSGHIPGAIHYEWTEAMDRGRHLRVRPLDDLRKEMAELGLSADKEIITHCQTHHRSSFSWLVGKVLGLNIRAYAGSWSEWGNHPDTPVEKDLK